MGLEKDVPLGTVGVLKATLGAGKGRLELSAKSPDGIFNGGAFVEEDSATLMNSLFALIEAHSPAGFVPIEEGAKAIILANIAKA